MERVNGAVKVGTSGFKYGLSKLLFIICSVLVGIVWIIDKIFLIIRKIGLIMGFAFFFSWFIYPVTGSNNIRSAYEGFFSQQMWKQREGIIAIFAALFLGLIVWIVCAILYGRVHMVYEWFVDVRQGYSDNCHKHTAEIKRYSKIAKGDMHDEYLRLCERYRQTNVNYVSRL